MEEQTLSKSKRQRSISKINGSVEEVFEGGAYVEATINKKQYYGVLFEVNSLKDSRESFISTDINHATSSSLSSSSSSSRSSSSSSDHLTLQNNNIQGNVPISSSWNLSSHIQLQIESNHLPNWTPTDLLPTITKNKQLLTSSSNHINNNNKTKHRIIVIGAGISGLTAASELEKLGYEVIVLEGRNRIGGRIYTHTFHNNIQVDEVNSGHMGSSSSNIDDDDNSNNNNMEDNMEDNIEDNTCDVKTVDNESNKVSVKGMIDIGASWIHGIENNPLTMICNEANLSLIDTCNDVTMYDQCKGEGKGGKKISKVLDDYILSKHDKILDISKQLGIEKSYNIALKEYENKLNMIKLEKEKIEKDEMIKRKKKEETTVMPCDLKLIGKEFTDDNITFIVYQITYSLTHLMKIVWYYDKKEKDLNVNDRTYHFSTLKEVISWIEREKEEENDEKKIKERENGIEEEEERVLKNDNKGMLDNNKQEDMFTKKVNQKEQEDNIVINNKDVTSMKTKEDVTPLIKVEDKVEVDMRHGCELSLGETMQQVYYNMKMKMPTKEEEVTNDSIKKNYDEYRENREKIKKTIKTNIDDYEGLSDVEDNNHVNQHKDDEDDDDIKNNNHIKNDDVKENNNEDQEDNEEALLKERLLQWHLANIEYSTSAEVNDLSLKYWDQDDENAFEGSHCLIKEGYGAIVDNIAENVSDIRLNWNVTNVEYGFKVHVISCNKTIEHGLGITLAQYSSIIGTITVKICEIKNNELEKKNNDDRPCIGDIILKINNENMEGKSANDMAMKLSTIKIGTIVQIHVLRNPNIIDKKGAASSSSSLSGSLSIGKKNLKNELKGKKCLVTGEKDGDLLWADAVIVTVPLGVLKANKIQFVPPLPPAKTASIKKLGYGNLEKVIVQFPYNFWRNKMNDKNLFIGRLQHVNQIYLNKNNKNKEKKVYKNISDQNGLNYHTMNDDDKGEERGMFFWFVDMSKIANCPTLVAIIPAKASKILNIMSEDEVINKCYKSLQSIFGDQIPYPNQYKITNWNQDPYSLGSYSYFAKNTTFHDIENYKSNINDIIYFCGEATSIEYPSMVHGAYLSGIDIASSIDNYFNPIINSEKQKNMKKDILHSSFCRKKIKDFSSTTTTTTNNNNNTTTSSMNSCGFCRITFGEEDIVDGEKNGHFDYGDVLGPFIESSTNQTHNNREGSNRKAHLSSSSLFWVHESCALYSPEVYADTTTAANKVLKNSDNIKGKDSKCIWYNVTKAYKRGKLIQCKHCLKRGATVGCYNKSCKKSYHVRCSSLFTSNTSSKKKNNSNFNDYTNNQEKKYYYCEEHREKKETKSSPNKGKRMRDEDQDSSTNSSDAPIMNNTEIRHRLLN